MCVSCSHVGLNPIQYPISALDIDLQAMASGSVVKESPSEPPPKMPRRRPSVAEWAAEKAAADDAIKELRTRIGADASSAAEAFVFMDELMGIEATITLSENTFRDACSRLADLKRRQSDAASRADLLAMVADPADVDGARDADACASDPADVDARGSEE